MGIPVRHGGDPAARPGSVLLAKAPLGGEPRASTPTRGHRTDRRSRPPVLLPNANSRASLAHRRLPRHSHFACRMNPVLSGKGAQSPPLSHTLSRLTAILECQGCLGSPCEVCIGT